MSDKEIEASHTHTSRKSGIPINIQTTIKTKMPIILLCSSLLMKKLFFNN